MRSGKKSNWLIISERFVEVFQKNLIQIALYNKKYTSGEIVVILEDDSIPQITSAYTIINSIQKKKMSVPVFLSKEYIEQSLNSFPLEFLHIQSSFQNLYHRVDLIKSLSFDDDAILNQMIRELDSKSLHLKMNFLEFYGNILKLKNLINVSILSIIPILIGFLRMNNLDPSNTIETDIQQVERILGNSLNSFYIASKSLNKLDFITLEEIDSFFTQYLDQINILKQHLLRLKK